MFGWLYNSADHVRHVGRSRHWGVDQVTGRRGEDLAHRFLRERGFHIVARNYRLSSGDAEVDLIARDGDVLVFIEVKTRRSADYGPPERAIGAQKRSKLLRAARVYVAGCRISWDRVRFDVVGIVLTPDLHIDHAVDAFRPFQANTREVPMARSVRNAPR